MMSILALIYSLFFPFAPQIGPGLMGPGPGLGSASTNYSVDGFIDFESGSNGDPVTTSNIDNHGSSFCTWSIAGGPSTLQTISTTNAYVLPGTVDVAGVGTFTGNPSTRSYKFDPAGTTTTQSVNCSIGSGGFANFSAGAYYTTTSTTQAPLSIFFGATDNLGGDYVLTHWNNSGATTGLHIKSGNTCLPGDPIPITPNHAYWVTVQYSKGSGSTTHKMYVFDPDTWTLAGYCTVPSSSNTNALLFIMGRAGLDASAGVGQWYFDDMLLSSTGKFPLVPRAINVNAPSLSVSSGTYNTDQSVTITDLTPGASIVYCMDTAGTCTPATAYTGAISVASTSHVRSKATLSGWTDSSITDNSYVLQTATVTDSPGAGSYGSAQTVTLSDATPSAYICYTVDGSTPTGTNSSCTNGTHYTSGFSVSSTTTVKAIANYGAYDQSALLSSTYTITVTPSLTSSTCSNYAFSTSVTCVYSGSVTSGNWLYVTAQSLSSTIAFSGCGITWTTVTTSGGAQGIGQAVSTGACTVTASWTGSAGTGIAGVEVQNTSGVDVKSGPTSQGFIGANNTFNCPAVTTTQNGDLVMCGAGDSSGTSGAYTAGTSYTIKVQGSGSRNAGIEYLTQGTAGSITPTAKYSAGATIYTNTVAFKP